MTTTRKRVLSLRLSDAEYQALKQQASAAGTSVPLHARRLALDSIEIGPRLDALERQISSIPNKAALLEAFQRLASKIDRAAGAKGATP